VFKSTSRTRVAGLLVVLLCTTFAGVRATEPARPGRWAGWRFVLGEWVGEGTGAPGEATGSFAFTPELDGNVLVRRSHADYPPAGGRPGFRHEDLMLIYREAGEAYARTLYLDNEGHVIHYAAQVSASEDTLTFLSDRAPGSPGFRFTYVKASERRLKFRFEIAPPARPDSFSIYLQGTARRKSARRLRRPDAASPTE
jgi:hypothetical protein